MFELTLEEAQQLVEHLMNDHTREGLLLADLVNSRLGASARRRAAAIPNLKLYGFYFGWMGSCVVAAHTPDAAFAIVRKERPEVFDKGRCEPTLDSAWEIDYSTPGIVHNDMGDQ